MPLPDRALVVVIASGQSAAPSKARTCGVAWTSPAPLVGNTLPIACCVLFHSASSGDSRSCTTLGRAASPPPSLLMLANLSASMSSASRDSLLRSAMAPAPLPTKALAAE